MSEINFGILESLAHQANVSDIAVTCDGQVWIDEGAGMELVSGESGSVPAFRSAEEIRMYAVQLCSQLGRRLDDSLPITDAASAKGIRVHAVLAPIVPQGAAISIRLLSMNKVDVESLSEAGFIHTALVGVFRELVRKKATWIITGGTGTGKTTLVKALMNECDRRERIVTVEEVRELSGCTHENMVSLVTRGANVEGVGAIGLSELVKATVRMRPDRIVLGECRGEEIAELLRAFNSGHRGGFVTIHADSVERLPSRLIALGRLAGLSEKTISALTDNAFDVIVHCSRVNGRRFVSHIGVLRRGSSDEIVGTTLLEVCPSDPERESGIAVIDQCGGWDDFAHQWGLDSSVKGFAESSLVKRNPREGGS